MIKQGELDISSLQIWALSKSPLCFFIELIPLVKLLIRIFELTRFRHG